MRYKIEKNEIHPNHYRAGLIIAGVSVIASMLVFTGTAFLISIFFLS